MSTRRVEIETTGPSEASIKIDGVDVARHVQAFDLRHEGNRPPVLTLYLAGGTIYRGEAGVVLPEWLHEALTALGWTPPEGTSA